MKVNRLSLGLQEQLKEASNFSWEKEPSYWYKENQGMLPCGCHAWEKYEKTSFWMKHIEGIKE